MAAKGVHKDPAHFCMTWSPLPGIPYLADLVFQAEFPYQTPPDHTRMTAVFICPPVF